MVHGVVKVVTDFISGEHSFSSRSVLRNKGDIGRIDLVNMVWDIRSINNPAMEGLLGIEAGVAYLDITLWNARAHEIPPLLKQNLLNQAILKILVWFNTILASARSLLCK